MPASILTGELALDSIPFAGAPAKQCDGRGHGTQEGRGPKVLEMAGDRTVRDVIEAVHGLVTGHLASA
eukprot:5940608-Lingulodinium_polyedra.AAC.1